MQSPIAHAAIHSTRAPTKRQPTAVVAATSVLMRAPGLFQVVPAGDCDLSSRDQSRPRGHLCYHAEFTPLVRNVLLGYICQVARPRPSTDRDFSMFDASLFATP